MSASPDRGRRAAELRPVELELHWAPYAEGSCLVSTGSTRVLCTASVEDDVPPWRKESGGGWVTAEYAMLPRATHSRRSRERGRVGGRTKEIQRLIGRSLRAVVDLDALGPRTVIVDCDVLQADGGTRTASVTGGGVALALAFRRLRERGELPSDPLQQLVAAVSVGMVGGEVVLDLDYRADRDADVDMNVVGTEDGRLVEVQGTAEGAPFGSDDLGALTELALDGIGTLIRRQRRALNGEQES